MRTNLATMICLSVLLLTTWPARADETPAADPPAPESKAADEQQEFKPPPGFRARKRGQFIVYCRREDVMGTRTVSERCYDEQGIRDLLQSQRENREKVDQMRRICGSQAACGGS